MRHLEKFICYEANEEILRVYQEIKRQPQRYVNTTFEFIVDPNVKFDTISEEFKEGTIKKKTCWH
jgi:hypothetical protein